MIKSEFNRKAHTNFQNYILYAICFCYTLALNRSFEVHIELNLYFGHPIDVINHFNGRNSKNTINLGVNNTTT